jgi:hypothetical protein
MLALSACIQLGDAAQRKASSLAVSVLVVSEM